MRLRQQQQNNCFTVQIFLSLLAIEIWLIMIYLFRKKSIADFHLSAVLASVAETCILDALPLYLEFFSIRFFPLEGGLLWHFFGNWFLDLGKKSFAQSSEPGLCPRKFSM